MEKDSPSSVSVVIKDLVVHYSQPIHARLLADLPSPICGEPTEQLPLVVSALLDRLIHIDDDVRAIALQLLEGYRLQIRQSVFTSHNNLLIDGISTLENYVWLLKSFLGGPISPIISLESGDASKTLSTTLLCLASDLTLATVVSEEERNADDETAKLKSSLRKNRLMPSLMMVIIQTLKCATELNICLDKDSLRNCYVSLLACKYGKMDPREVETTIESKVCDLSEYRLVPLQPSSATDLFLSRIMPWSDVQTDSNHWMDVSCELLVHECWKALGSAVLHTDTRLQTGISISTVKLQGLILERLGVEHTTKILRSHFFGRNEFSHEVEKGTYELHLGHRMYIPATEQSQKSYERVPSRVFVALHFIATLPMLTQPILDDLLPILYELLSTANDTLIALGCAFLYRLAVVSRGYEQSLFWPLDNIWSALGEVAKTCRVGPTIILTGLAQRSVLSLASTAEHRQQLCSKIHQSRLQSTQRWLLILDDHCHRAPGDDKNHLIQGLIVTLIPDLYCHKDRNASAVQVGRVGLRCFLQILTNLSLTTHEDREDGNMVYLILTLDALSNLLIVAHPIMKHHAGKLLTTLVGVSLHFHNNSTVTRLVEHVGGMALLVCRESHHLQSTLERLRSEDFKDTRTREMVEKILFNFQVAADLLVQKSS